jgi:hypothetical protein
MNPASQKEAMQQTAHEKNRRFNTVHDEIDTEFLPRQQVVERTLLNVVYIMENKDRAALTFSQIATLEVYLSQLHQLQGQMVALSRKFLALLRESGESPTEPAGISPAQPET